jgi:hypothetical protein
LEHQVTIAQELADKIESNPDIKLLAIRNLTKFILTAEDGGILKKVLSILQQACTKK